jgi:hypothetical protein
MNKGQIFSIDMLFGMIVLILGVGVLLGAAEINFYNFSQQIRHDELVQKTITGAQVITNSKYFGCKFGEANTAYSINYDTIRSITLEQLKEKANLLDYNIRLTVSGEVLFDDIENSKNLVGVDLDILHCTNYATFNGLKECLTSNPTCGNGDVKKTTFRLEVAK